MNKWLAQHKKAIGGFTLGLLLAFGKSISDGNLTGSEVLGSLGAAIIGFAGIYATPANKAKDE